MKVVALFLLVLSIEVNHQDLPHKDYVYSSRDKSLKNLAAGSWIRLDSDGKGYFIEWDIVV
jgi:hypothetical protein